MLLYYHLWIFYNHFIARLYHFLGLTYWHSAQCQLLFFACFLLRRKSIPNGIQMQQNFLEIFCGPEDTSWAKEVPEGGSEGRKAHQGAPGQGSTRRVLRGEHNPPGRTLVASRTTSLLYKYLNIPETIGKSTKINSSRRKFQNHQIQSRHHHRGVHHPHWCLSDDAWVVHYIPTGL